MNRLFRLYTLEAEFKERGLEGDRLIEARNGKDSSAAVMGEVRQYLSTVVTANTALRKAIDYFLNNYKTMSNFLSDPDATIYNNMAEQGFKIVAIDRNNFLFVRSEVGGQACAIHLTIQQNALHCGLDPCEYEEFLLETVRKRDFDHDYDKLMPWHPGIRGRIEEYRRTKARLFSLSEKELG